MNVLALLLQVSGDALLDQPVRKRLMGLIRRSPGIHASEICRETGEAWGTVQYHLSLLQNNEMVMSMEIGRTKRFYSPDAAGSRMEMIGMLSHGRRAEIARFILDNPGLRQVDVCKAVAVSRKTFRSSMAGLVDAGLVAEHKGLQTNRYFPDEALAPLLDTGSGIDVA